MLTRPHLQLGSLTSSSGKGIDESPQGDNLTSGDVGKLVDKKRYYPTDFSVLHRQPTKRQVPKLKGSCYKEYQAYLTREPNKSIDNILRDIDSKKNQLICSDSPEILDEIKSALQGRCVLHIKGYKEMLHDLSSHFYADDHKQEHRKDIGPLKTIEKEGGILLLEFDDNTDYNVISSMNNLILQSNITVIGVIKQDTYSKKFPSDLDSRFPNFSVVSPTSFPISKKSKTQQEPDLTLYVDEFSSLNSLVQQFQIEEGRTKTDNGELIKGILSDNKTICLVGDPKIIEPWLQPYKDGWPFLCKGQEIRTKGITFIVRKYTEEEIQASNAIWEEFESTSATWTDLQPEKASLVELNDFTFDTYFSLSMDDSESLTTRPGKLRVPELSHIFQDTKFIITYLSAKKKRILSRFINGLPTDSSIKKENFILVKNSHEEIKKTKLSEFRFDSNAPATTLISSDDPELTISQLLAETTYSDSNPIPCHIINGCEKSSNPFNDSYSKNEAGFKKETSLLKKALAEGETVILTGLSKCIKNEIGHLLRMGHFPDGTQLKGKLYLIDSKKNMSQLCDELDWKEMVDDDSQITEILKLKFPHMETLITTIDESFKILNIPRAEHNNIPQSNPLTQNKFLRLLEYMESSDLDPTNPNFVFSSFIESFLGEYSPDKDLLKKLKTEIFNIFRKNFMESFNYSIDDILEINPPAPDTGFLKKNLDAGNVIMVQSKPGLGKTETILKLNNDGYKVDPVSVSSLTSLTDILIGRAEVDREADTITYKNGKLVSNKDNDNYVLFIDEALNLAIPQELSFLNSIYSPPPCHPHQFKPLIEKYNNQLKVSSDQNIFETLQRAGVISRTTHRLKNIDGIFNDNPYCFHDLLFHKTIDESTIESFFRDLKKCLEPNVMCLRNSKGEPYYFTKKPKLVLASNHIGEVGRYPSSVIQDIVQTIPKETMDDKKTILSAHLPKSITEAQEKIEQAFDFFDTVNQLMTILKIDYPFSIRDQIFSTQLLHLFYPDVPIEGAGLGLTEPTQTRKFTLTEALSLATFFSLGGLLDKDQKDTFSAFIYTKTGKDLDELIQLAQEKDEEFNGFCDKIKAAHHDFCFHKNSKYMLYTIHLNQKLRLLKQSSTLKYDGKSIVYFEAEPGLGKDTCIDYYMEAAGIKKDEDYFDFTMSNNIETMNDILEKLKQGKIIRISEPNNVPTESIESLLRDAHKIPGALIFLTANNFPDLRHPMTDPILSRSCALTCIKNSASEFEEMIESKLKNYPQWIKEYVKDVFSRTFENCPKNKKQPGTRHLLGICDTILKSIPYHSEGIREFNKVIENELNKILSKSLGRFSINSNTIQPSCESPDVFLNQIAPLFFKSPIKIITSELRNRNTYTYDSKSDTIYLDCPSIQGLNKNKLALLIYYLSLIEEDTLTTVDDKYTGLVKHTLPKLSSDYEAKQHLFSTHPHLTDKIPLFFPAAITRYQKEHPFLYDLITNPFNHPLRDQQLQDTVVEQCMLQDELFKKIQTKLGADFELVIEPTKASYLKIDMKNKKITLSRPSKDISARFDTALEILFDEKSAPNQSLSRVVIDNGFISSIYILKKWLFKPKAKGYMFNNFVIQPLDGKDGVQADINSMHLDIEVGTPLTQTSLIKAIKFQADEVLLDLEAADRRRRCRKITLGGIATGFTAAVGIGGGLSGKSVASLVSDETSPVSNGTINSSTILPIPSNPFPPSPPELIFPGLFPHNETPSNFLNGTEKPYDEGPPSSHGIKPSGSNSTLSDIFNSTGIDPNTTFYDLFNITGIDPTGIDPNTTLSSFLNKTGKPYDERPPISHNITVSGATSSVSGSTLQSLDVPEQITIGQGSYSPSSTDLAFDPSTRNGPPLFQCEKSSASYIRTNCYAPLTTNPTELNAIPPLPDGRNLVEQTPQVITVNSRLILDRNKLVIPMAKNSAWPSSVTITFQNDTSSQHSEFEYRPDIGGWVLDLSNITEPKNIKFYKVDYKNNAQTLPNLELTIPQGLAFNNQIDETKLTSEGANRFAAIKDALNLNALQSKHSITSDDLVQSLTALETLLKSSPLFKYTFKASKKCYPIYSHLNYYEFLCETGEGVCEDYANMFAWAIDYFIRPFAKSKNIEIIAQVSTGRLKCEDEIGHAWPMVYIKQANKPPSVFYFEPTSSNIADQYTRDQLSLLRLGINFNIQTAYQNDTGIGLDSTAYQNDTEIGLDSKEILTGTGLMLFLLIFSEIGDRQFSSSEDYAKKHYFRTMKLLAHASTQFFHLFSSHTGLIPFLSFLFSSLLIELIKSCTAHYVNNSKIQKHPPITSTEFKLEPDDTPLTKKQTPRKSDARYGESFSSKSLPVVSIEIDEIEQTIPLDNLSVEEESDPYQTVYIFKIPPLIRIQTNHRQYQYSPGPTTCYTKECKYICKTLDVEFGATSRLPYQFRVTVNTDSMQKRGLSPEEVKSDVNKIGLTLKYSTSSSSEHSLPLKNLEYYRDDSDENTHFLKIPTPYGKCPDKVNLIPGSDCSDSMSSKIQFLCLNKENFKMETVYNSNLKSWVLKITETQPVSNLLSILRSHCTVEVNYSSATFDLSGNEDIFNPNQDSKDEDIPNPHEFKILSSYFESYDEDYKNAMQKLTCDDTSLDDQAKVAVVLRILNNIIAFYTHYHIANILKAFFKVYHDHPVVKQLILTIHKTSKTPFKPNSFEDIECHIFYEGRKIKTFTANDHERTQYIPLTKDVPKGLGSAVDKTLSEQDKTLAVSLLTLTDRNITTSSLGKSALGTPGQLVLVDFVQGHLDSCVKTSLEDTKTTHKSLVITPNNVPPTPALKSIDHFMQSHKKVNEAARSTSPPIKIKFINHLGIEESFIVEDFQSLLLWISFLRVNKDSFWSKEPSINDQHEVSLPKDFFEQKLSPPGLNKIKFEDCDIEPVINRNHEILFLKNIKIAEEGGLSDDEDDIHAQGLGQFPTTSSEGSTIIGPSQQLTLKTPNLQGLLIDGIPNLKTLHFTKGSLDNILHFDVNNCMLLEEITCETNQDEQKLSWLTKMNPDLCRLRVTKKQVHI